MHYVRYAACSGGYRHKILYLYGLPMNCVWNYRTFVANLNTVLETSSRLAPNITKCSMAKKIIHINRHVDLFYR
uniref:Uncharacterized protein n=1 Tax=Pararge aegeria TaxID=116150 RepID=S4PZ41_9NEOP